MVNPFIDEDAGPSDLLLKALRFKMKVWEVKSESRPELRCLSVVRCLADAYAPLSSPS